MRPREVQERDQLVQGVHHAVDRAGVGALPGRRETLRAAPRLGDGLLAGSELLVEVEDLSEVAAYRVLIDLRHLRDDIPTAVHLMQMSA